MQFGGEFAAHVRVGDVVAGRVHKVLGAELHGEAGERELVRGLVGGERHEQLVAGSPVHVQLLVGLSVATVAGYFGLLWHIHGCVGGLVIWNDSM